MKEHAIISKARLTLQQLSGVLLELTDDQYQQKIDHLNHSSIGEHARHVLEMYEELINGHASGIVCYENRRRDFNLETIRATALSRLEMLMISLNRSDVDLVLEQKFINGEVQTHQIPTSYLREVVYNIEHTVHHMALIRVAIKEMQLDNLVSDAFGYADSTILHRKAKGITS